MNYSELKLEKTEAKQIQSEAESYLKIINNNKRIFFEIDKRMEEKIVDLTDSYNSLLNKIDGILNENNLIKFKPNGIKINKDYALISGTYIPVSEAQKKLEAIVKGAKKVSEILNQINSEISTVPKDDNSLTKIFMKIELNYLKLNYGAKKELILTLEKLTNYLSSRPNEEKLRTLKLFLDKEIRKKAGKQLRISGTNLSELQILRNSIAHNKPINKADLLQFANFLWEEMPMIYENDTIALYNTLSYAIRPDEKLILDSSFSSKDVTALFRNIYESRTEREKIEIIKILIPLINVKFKERAAELGT